MLGRLYTHVSCILKIGNSWSPLTFADALHCADLRPIFHGMQREVNLGDRLLLVDSSQSIVDLDPVLDVQRHQGTGGGLLAVHGDGN